MGETCSIHGSENKYTGLHGIGPTIVGNFGQPAVDDRIILKGILGYSLRGCELIQGRVQG
jgi:hypothetical protein